MMQGSNAMGGGNNMLPMLMRARIKLISHYREFNSSKIANELEELRSKAEFNPHSLRALGEILANDWLRESAFYALERGALSHNILVNELGISLVRSTRIIQTLVSNGLLYPALALQRPRSKKGGPRVKIYQTPDALPEQVSRAVELQNRLDSPKYRQAILVAQTLLDDYPNIIARGETTYSEIMNAIRRMNITYSVADIAQLTSKYLYEKGIRVWK
jgi:hypothetical protein